MSEGTPSVKVGKPFKPPVEGTANKPRNSNNQ